LSTYQFIENLGDQNSFSYFESYLLQLQNELEPETLGQNSIDELIDDYIVSQEAENLGISVSQSEVQKRVNEVMFQYFPDGTPTPAPTNAIFPTPTFSEIQMTLIPPTPTELITDTEQLSDESTPQSDETDFDGGLSPRMGRGGLGTGTEITEAEELAVSGQLESLRSLSASEPLRASELTVAAMQNRLGRPAGRLCRA